MLAVGGRIDITREQPSPQGDTDRYKLPRGTHSLLTHSAYSARREAPRCQNEETARTSVKGAP
jgi:hypothetical protein